MLTSRLEKIFEVLYMYKFRFCVLIPAPTSGILVENLLTLHPPTDCEYHH